jgi:hypothetical protein
MAFFHLDADASFTLMQLHPDVKLHACASTCAGVARPAGECDIPAASFDHLVGTALIDL